MSKKKLSVECKGCKKLEASLAEENADRIRAEEYIWKLEKDTLRNKPKLLKEAERQGRLEELKLILDEMDGKGREMLVINRQGLKARIAELEKEGE